MNKSIYVIAAVLVLLPIVALAGNGNGPGQGDGSCVGNCPQNGGGGPTEVTNENTNTNHNDSTAVAGAISGSSADSTATGIGVGGSSVVGVAVKTGPTVSGSQSNATGGQGGHGGNAHASGGDAYARGGDSYSRSYSEGSNAGASVGDVTSSSGPSTASSNSGGNSQSLGVSIKGDTVTYEDSASKAATVYTQVCENGGSAQAKAGGFSVVNQDVVCEHLKVAAVMREAYVWELNHGSANCVESMSGPKMDNGVTYSDVCFNEKAMEYYKAYHEHMTEAIQAMEAYEEVGLLDKISGALVRPMALIGALIWLI